MNYLLASAYYSVCITNEHNVLQFSLDYLNIYQTDMDDFDKKKVKLGGNLFNQKCIREVERIFELIGQILDS